MNNFESIPRKINLEEKLSQLMHPENRESVNLERIEQVFSGLNKDSTKKCCEKLNI